MWCSSKAAQHHDEVQQITRYLNVPFPSRLTPTLGCPRWLWLSHVQLLVVHLQKTNTVPAWCVSVCRGCSSAPVPRSGGVGDVDLRRRTRPPLQRAHLQRVDEGVKDALGRIKNTCVQAQKAYEVLLTCAALG